MNSEGGSKSFTFFLSEGLFYCFRFSHLLIQFIQYQLNILLATCGKFPGPLDMRHFLSQDNLQRFLVFGEVTKILSIVPCDIQ